MTVCDQATLQSSDTLIAMALDEDLGRRGDLTSLATVPAEAVADVNIVAREDGALSGVVLVERVYTALLERQGADASDVQVNVHVSDGQRIEVGTVVATVSGSIQILLSLTQCH